MKCTGCIPSSKFCTFIKKNCEKLMEDEIQYCYECSDFVCAQLQKLDKRYRKRFDMGMIKNLKYIKENGMEKFLEKQEEKYNYLTCGNLVYVPKKKCYTCE